MPETDWEARYQLGDTPWEKGAPSPGLLDFLASNAMAGRVAVVGCGFGNDVRAISRTGADVVGLDLASSAIMGAEKLPRTGNELYRQADLFSLPQDLLGGFDWVFEHTCFCAIDPSRRSEYVSALDLLLKSGGHFLAVFYMTPDHEGGPPFGCTEPELVALFGERFELLRQWIPQRSYPGREGRELMRLMRKKA